MLLILKFVTFIACSFPSNNNTYCLTQDGIKIYKTFVCCLTKLKWKTIVLFTSIELEGLLAEVMEYTSN